MRRLTVLVAVLVGCSGTTTTISSDCPQGDIPEYVRKDWGRWIDDDKDCQDTRQEVLIAESEVEVTFTDEKKCRVATGKWNDRYTGQVFTDPSKLDIDHMVALKDAHVSGGYAWDKELKRHYSNDLSNPWHLMAVSASANRSKGARGPDEWLPPNEAFRCEYVEEWSAVKENWELLMPEREVIYFMLRVCEKGGILPLPQEK